MAARRGAHRAGRGGGGAGVLGRAARGSGGAWEEGAGAAQEQKEQNPLNEK
jgi:hypothetical protein